MRTVYISGSQKGSNRNVWLPSVTLAPATLQVENNKQDSEKNAYLIVSNICPG